MQNLNFDMNSAAFANELASVDIPFGEGKILVNF